MPDPAANQRADAAPNPALKRSSPPSILIVRGSAEDSPAYALGEQAARGAAQRRWRVAHACACDLAESIRRGRLPFMVRDLGLTAALLPLGGDEALALAPTLSAAGLDVVGLPEQALATLADDDARDAFAKKAYVPSHRAVLRELAAMPESFNELVYVDAEILVDHTGATVPVALVERVGAKNADDPGEALLTPATCLTPIAGRGLMEMASRLGAALGIAGPLRARFSIHGERGSLIGAEPIASPGFAMAAAALAQPLGQAVAELALGATIRECAFPRERHPKAHFARRWDGATAGPVVSAETRDEALRLARETKES